MFAKQNGRLTHLRLLRLLNNLSQDELGLAIGLSGSYVSRIERGLVPVPEHARAAIGKALGDSALSETHPPAFSQSVTGDGGDQS